MDKNKGTFIVWVNRGHDGWRPTFCDTLGEAQAVYERSMVADSSEIVVTRRMVVKLQFEDAV